MSLLKTRRASRGKRVRTVGLWILFLVVRRARMSMWKDLDPWVQNSWKLPMPYVLQVVTIPKIEVTHSTFFVWIFLFPYLQFLRPLAC